MILFFPVFRFLSLTLTEETITRRWNAQDNFLYFKLLLNISSFKTLRNILTVLSVFGCRLSRTMQQRSVFRGSEGNVCFSQRFLFSS